MVRIYKSVRFTKGNILCKTTLKIDTRKKLVLVIKRNSNFIGYTIKCIKFRNISAVTLIERSEFFYFSEVLIESYGGKYDLSINGLSLHEAREIKNRLSRYR